MSKESRRLLKILLTILKFAASQLELFLREKEDEIKKQNI